MPVILVATSEKKALTPPIELSNNSLSDFNRVLDFPQVPLDSTKDRTPNERESLFKAMPGVSNVALLSLDHPQFLRLKNNFGSIKRREKYRRNKTKHETKSGGQNNLLGECGLQVEKIVREMLKRNFMLSEDRGLAFDYTGMINGKRYVNSRKREELDALILSNGTPDIIVEVKFRTQWTTNKLFEQVTKRANIMAALWPHIRAMVIIVAPKVRLDSRRADLHCWENVVNATFAFKESIRTNKITFVGIPFDLVCEQGRFLEMPINERSILAVNQKFEKELELDN